MIAERTGEQKWQIIWIYVWKWRSTQNWFAVKDTGDCPWYDWICFDYLWLWNNSVQDMRLFWYRFWSWIYELDKLGSFDSKIDVIRRIMLVENDGGICYIYFVLRVNPIYFWLDPPLLMQLFEDRSWKYW